MSITRKMALLAISALFTLIVWGGGTQVRADTPVVDCPDMPLVSWWGNTSPEKISSYVEHKHHGDWVGYIVKWQKYEKNMRSIHRRDKSAVIKSKNIVIKGDDLAIYVKMIAKRVAVLQCYAEQLAPDKYLIDLIDGKQSPDVARKPS